MTVEATEKTPGKRGAPGPRVFYALKENPNDRVPTARDRVIGESIRKKAKEVTGQDVSLIHTLAIKFTMSRWYEDPATKELLNDMDSQLKRAKAKEKEERARKLLEEAQQELADVESEDDEDSDDASEDEDVAAAGAGEDEEESSDDDPFDDDEKVSATF